ncbi:hypothetical protein EDD85DRAFT_349667 [Armillaria nabsnona]|nr:hypothetical protein EDD85DRAFT_349667 [Armillaria nabsnona]
MGSFCSLARTFLPLRYALSSSSRPAMDRYAFDSTSLAIWMVGSRKHIAIIFGEYAVHTGMSLGTCSFLPSWYSNSGS